MAALQLNWSVVNAARARVNVVNALEEEPEAEQVVEPGVIEQEARQVVLPEIIHEDFDLWPKLVLTMDSFGGKYLCRRNFQHLASSLLSGLCHHG
uniref:Uncharacterized protein n=1 Tax=Ditylenchus dipsaci TaxID=166011 RepID=A0A915DNM2_9BILA